MDILSLIGRERELFFSDINKYNQELKDIISSMARFANMSFLDGSFFYGFNQRIQKKQPIVALNDIKRYFVTPKEIIPFCEINLNKVKVEEL